MARSNTDTSNILSVALKLAPLMLASVLLGGCETTGPGPAVQAAAPPEEEPMTQSRAAQECWMAAEKKHAMASLDRRADIVTKCIDEKMKAAELAPKG